MLWAHILRTRWWKIKHLSRGPCRPSADKSYKGENVTQNVLYPKVFSGAAALTLCWDSSGDRMGIVTWITLLILNMKGGQWWPKRHLLVGLQGSHSRGERSTLGCPSHQSKTHWSLWFPAFTLPVGWSFITPLIRELKSRFILGIQSRTCSLSL